MPSAPALASVTFNSLADVERCMPGQARLAAELGVRLAVADNASTDGTAERLGELAAEHEAITLVQLPENRGFAAGANAAIAASGRGDALLVNPDLVLDYAEEAVLRLAAKLEADPRAGIVAPRLLYENGDVQPSCRRSPDPVAYLGSLPRFERVGPFRRRYERFTAPELEGEPAPVDWVIGAAMLIRRQAFDRLGGFDEGFFLYLEDADLCMRMWGEGHRVLYSTEVSLIHTYKRRSQAEHGGAASSLERRHHMRSIARLFRRHPRMLLGRSRPALRGKP